MPTAKTIFVTGATGNQGGAVARNLLRNGFNVKALTRNASSPAAQQLKKLNAVIVEGDLDNAASYGDHLKDVDGVFGVFTYTRGIEREVRQGITLANQAKDNGVRHYIYSSVVGADQSTGIPHWESKFKIEKHIKQIGLPYTIIRPAALFENLLFPQVKSRLLKGKLVLPAHKNKFQQYISSEDIGRISTTMFMDPSKYTGRAKNIASETMSSLEIAAVFSKLWDKEIKYQQLPWIITRLAMGSDLYKMFRWINNNDAVFVKDLPAFRKEFPGLLSLEEWAKDYFR